MIRHDPAYKLQTYIWMVTLLHACVCCEGILALEPVYVIILSPNMFFLSYLQHTGQEDFLGPNYFEIKQYFSIDLKQCCHLYSYEILIIQLI